jgi:DNA-binding NtrC family response regulator
MDALFRQTDWSATPLRARALVAEPQTCQRHDAGPSSATSTRRETALELIDAHPEIVLLFTDVVMPEVNGAKLAEEARRRRPDLKVLFTTGYTQNAVVHNGVLDPGVEMIGKPFTLNALAAKTRIALDSQHSQADGK